MTILCLGMPHSNHKLSDPSKRVEFRQLLPMAKHKTQTLAWARMARVLEAITESSHEPTGLLPLVQEVSGAFRLWLLCCRAGDVSRLFLGFGGPPRNLPTLFT